MPGHPPAFRLACFDIGISIKLDCEPNEPKLCFWWKKVNQFGGIWVKVSTVAIEKEKSSANFSQSNETEMTETPLPIKTFSTLTGTQKSFNSFNFEKFSHSVSFSGLFNNLIFYHISWRKGEKSLFFLFTYKKVTHLISGNTCFVH